MAHPSSSFSQQTLDGWVQRSSSSTEMQAQRNNLLPKSRLLRLPIEIRCMIYDCVFEGAKLELRYDDMLICSSKGKLSLTKLNVDQIIAKINLQNNKAAALLQAWDFCRQEALHSLAASTTIIIERGEQERRDLLATIDHDFLSFVRGVQMDPSTFIRANRELLPRLKEVTLSAITFDFDGEEIPHHGVLHTLSCHGCGDPEGTIFYEEFVDYMRSWDWKRKQLLHLAEDHGWKMRLVLYHEPMDISWGVGSAPWTRFELEYDMRTEKLINKSLLRFGRVVLSGSDFDDVEEVEMYFSIFQSEHRRLLEDLMDSEDLEDLED